MNYTVKNQKHDQDNINFIDVVDVKNEMPSFLDYNEVLAYSIEIGYIESEKNIKSLCDGGDHVQPYFSSENATYECETYVENTPFWTYDEDGNEIRKTLDFDTEIDTYELF
ncbi:hypothetical protein DMA11_10345 [Marinilabiliaceae bacterium JC017]|nr:hypothetical protein DMA11_10345 [Marinilabiliaceae bacterium JC017]